MYSRQLEALFLQPPKELSEANNREKIVATAGLSTHPVLQEALNTAIRARVLDALGLLNERKFEEGYAELQSADALMELQGLFSSSRDMLVEERKRKAQTEASGTKVEREIVDRVKY